MEVIIRWVDYILTSCPVWRGTLPDTSDLSDSPLSNIKMLADVKTDEQYHHDASDTSDTSDASDHYSISTNSIVLSSDHVDYGENQIQSNITDVSNTTRNRQDDLQKSPKIFRLGRLILGPARIVNKRGTYTICVSICVEEDNNSSH